MILYGATMSPFVRKALAFAAEKGVDVTSRPVGLGSTNPDFLAASPFRKIPALADGDFTLADSSAIVHYLDAQHAEPELIPHAARARATTVWWDEFADTIFVAAAGKLFFNRVVAPRFLGRDGDLAAADKAEAEELPPILDHIERMLPASGHLVEDRLTLADLAVASPFVNLSHAGHAIDAARHPRITDFVRNMLARPSFATMVAAERAALAG